MKREMDLQNLVKSRGHIILGLDASSCFTHGSALVKKRRLRGQRLVAVQNASSFLSFIKMPVIKQAVVQHAWETRLSEQSTLTLSGQAVARNGIGGGNISATLKQSLPGYIVGEVD